LSSFTYRVLNFLIIVVIYTIKDILINEEMIDEKTEKVPVLVGVVNSKKA
tara:strand:- start:317 stop:466 length:150 start_codon:yes stop_codon:yes gene_type:complete